MKLRYYIDTSVFGGYFDEEFQDDTKKFFSSLEHEKVKILFSELTENELKNAPEKVRSFVRSLPAIFIEFIDITKDSYELATKYISENVVGKTSYDDCVHIALATINRADVLISWNFKHIVNLKRIQGYNSVNMKNGYPTLEIRSPKEMIDYESKN